MNEWMTEIDCPPVLRGTQQQWWYGQWYDNGRIVEVKRRRRRGRRELWRSGHRTEICTRSHITFQLKLLSPNRILIGAVYQLPSESSLSSHSLYSSLDSLRCRSNQEMVKANAKEWETGYLLCLQWDWNWREELVNDLEFDVQNVTGRMTEEDQLQELVRKIFDHLLAIAYCE